VPLSKDTPLHIENLQLELFRKATPQKRFTLMQSFSHTLIQASRKNIQKRFDNPAEANIEWVRLHYGEALAEGLKHTLNTQKL
jgi:hypothetical protein